ncbi:MAG: transglutaminase-like domain-containing protein [Acidobacteriia bacterium]|nr:transglutaminase-like domain-containing protein [Terriglobia bacterium]
MPKGSRGTLVTARIVAQLINDGAKDLYVRQKAIEVFRAYRIRPKDRFGEVWSIFDWVRRTTRYTRDIFRVELLHSARRTLELKSGDCDDFTILLGAMLVSTGHPVRLVLAGFRPHKPHSYSHIYPEVLIGKRWVALDATTDKPMGWAPPAIWKRVCEIGKEGIQCSSKTC